MVRTSNIWAYFTRKEQNLATCNTCQHDYSYKSSLSNLMKHFVRKHGKPTDLTDVSNSDTSDGEQENTSTNKRKSTWSYYDVLDSDKFEATCKLCGTNVHYDSISDLVNHVKEHGEVPKDSDEEVDTTIQEKKPMRKVSKVWRYFKDLNTENKMALCMICQKTFSYSATVTNLKRHLVRKHRELVTFDDETDGEDAKKLIISANGQLYEVEADSGQMLEDNDGKEPIEMNTIYLEDLDDSIDHLQAPTKRSSTPFKNKPNTSLKRNFSKISKEQVKNNRDTCSDDEIPRKQIPANSMGSIDYFGQYVVSLLKELPKSVSDQLQSEIIKQILTSKMALESSGPSNYKITIKENNSNVPPPLISINSKDISEKKTEIRIENKLQNNETN